MRTRARRHDDTHGPRSSAGRRLRSLARLLAATTGALALSSCVAPCRAIEVRPLELECDPSSLFTGELHFDSEATFDTFLRQECLVGDGEADRVLASVDFTTEAVFVARGNHRLDETRCLARRQLDEAQVCATGLKLYFADEDLVSDTCPGTRWTVAFVLAREDLRAALDAAP